MGHAPRSDDTYENFIISNFWVGCNEDLHCSVNVNTMLLTQAVDNNNERVDFTLCAYQEPEINYNFVSNWLGNEDTVRNHRVSHQFINSTSNYFIICYRIDERRSFKDCEYEREKIRRILNLDEVPFILIGLYSGRDVEANREVTTSQAKDEVPRNALMFFEVSNVLEARSALQSIAQHHLTAIATSKTRQEELDKEEYIKTLGFKSQLSFKFSSKDKQNKLIREGTQKRAYQKEWDDFLSSYTNAVLKSTHSKDYKRFIVIIDGKQQTDESNAISSASKAVSDVKFVLKCKGTKVKIIYGHRVILRTHNQAVWTSLKKDKDTTLQENRKQNNPQSKEKKQAFEVNPSNWGPSAGIVKEQNGKGKEKEEQQEVKETNPENTSSRIKLIIDFDDTEQVNAFCHMLQFLYSRRLSKKWKKTKLQALKAIAEKYNFFNLKQFCKTKLSNKQPE